MEIANTRSAAHILLTLLVVLPHPLAPATITVDGQTSDAPGTSCDLAEAINNANDTWTGQPEPDCAAGDREGADTIELTEDVTLETSDTNTGLPWVTSTIEIQGNDYAIRRGEGLIVPLFGIFLVDAGDLTLQNTTVSGGDSPGNGGGISAYNSTVTLINSTLSGNSADFGGGIAAYKSTLTLTNSTLSGNSADYGGGIYNSSSTLTLTNSTLSGNSAALGNGGGIYSDSSTLTLTLSTLSGNSANFGGGIYSYSSTVTLTNSTLSGNSADWGGGGIFSNNHYDSLLTTTLTNSTLSGNSTLRRGGGIYNFVGTIALINSTLFGNSADTSGGGIYTFSEPSYFGVTSLANSVLANMAGGENCGGDGLVLDGGNNFADDGTCGAGVGALDFFDYTLADNGGPTLTHALFSGSPAIDAAGACAESEDQRGAGRVGDCDSGAFEYIGCGEVLLADDWIVGDITWEICHTARLANLSVAPGGILTVTTGALVILENDVGFLEDSVVILGVDPELQITSPESLMLQDM